MANKSIENLTIIRYYHYRYTRLSLIHCQAHSHSETPKSHEWVWRHNVQQTTDTMTYSMHVCIIMLDFFVFAEILNLPSGASEAPPTAPPPSPEGAAAVVFFFFFFVFGLFPVEAGMSPNMSSVFPKSSSSVLPLVFFFIDFFFFGSAAPSSANMSPSGSSLAAGGTWDWGRKRRFVHDSFSPSLPPSLFHLSLSLLLSQSLPPSLPLTLSLPPSLFPSLSLFFSSLIRTTNCVQYLRYIHVPTPPPPPPTHTLASCSPCLHLPLAASPPPSLSSVRLASWMVLYQQKYRPASSYCPLLLLWTEQRCHRLPNSS